MHHVEREAETAVGTFGMGHRQRAGSEPSWQPDAQPERFDEVIAAAKDECVVLDLHGQRHADAMADMLLESGRTCEPLGRMYDLRKATLARVEPCPDLAAVRHVFGHAHDARHVDVAAD